MATQIHKIKFPSFDASDINLLLNAFTVQETENQESFEKQLVRLEALKEFTLKHIDIESLPCQEAKHKYIRFLSKLNEMHEALEILTGQVSIEEIEAAGKSFARKTQFAIGIYD